MEAATKCVNLYFETHPTTKSWEYPDFAKLKITQADIDTWRSLTDFCKDNELLSVSKEAPIEWHENERYRMRGSCVVLLPNMLYFDAYPKEYAHHVESGTISLEVIQELFDEIESGGSFYWDISKEVVEDAIKELEEQTAAGFDDETD